MLIMADADHLDQLNVKNAMLSTNTFTVKEDEYQADSFVEDKVYISETAVTVDNAELQGSTWQAKIKEYEESTCLDNIKTEFISFEVTEVQNDNVKIGGVSNADNIKTEVDNGLLYCEHCEAYYEDYCTKCGMLVNILNNNASNNVNSGAQEDIPNGILEIRDSFGRTGIYSLRIIPAGVKFGPFTGLSATECPWEMKREKFVLNKSKSKYLNWMQYVNPTRNTCEGNLHVFQSEDNIYYQSTRQIQAGEELLVYFGEEYENSLNNIVRVNFVTTTKDIRKDVFACTFCCLGFNSKSQLIKHKTICVVGTAGMFSVEELTQCGFCKVHFDLKEYLEHHMAFCSETNARKRILQIPSAKQEIPAASKRHKRCLRPIYKCEQCKYRTKYPADLREHTKQHYKGKIYKCGICQRRFKTEEYLRLHVENTHAFTGGKNDQEHSTIDYRNTHVKVKHSRTRGQKKTFRCSLCVFRTKHKGSLRVHIQTKHLREFDFKCDSCEFRTNRKHHLEIHIKTKHLKEFDFKCDSCEYRTIWKHHLEIHLKTKHLKKFDFKCNFCEYRTNHKPNLEIHLKTKHLKEFDFKCDSCEFRTNCKRHLEIHIKTKHLKEFDFKCDSCEYRTICKRHLEIHIKTKHLKEFDFKCAVCEFRTNRKHHLEIHLKSKHLQEFDFKCDSCEYKTNSKRSLEGHLKSKHLQEFDFKCDSCEYKTNSKQSLEGHLKSKHLKEFDFKCDSCEYKTNSKQSLEGHLKSKHLKEFNFKCGSCEFRTNRKYNLEGHLKTKHWQKFDNKWDSCEFGTSHKLDLKNHIKTKYLQKCHFKLVNIEQTTNIV